jgi:Na+(H+)/acetate symporter ActP
MNLMGLSLCVVMGYRMRRYTGLGARTVPEVARIRFDSRLVQALAGGAMIILLIVYSVGQYKAMASVWTLTTGTGWLGSLVLTAILCAVYIVVGGYAGTQVSLALQGGIFMVIGWIFGIASIYWAGGPAKIAEVIAAADYVGKNGVVTTIPIGGYRPPSARPTRLRLARSDRRMFMFLLMATASRRTSRGSSAQEGHEEGVQHTHAPRRAQLRHPSDDRRVGLGQGRLGCRPHDIAPIFGDAAARL